MERPSTPAKSPGPQRDVESVCHEALGRGPALRDAMGTAWRCSQTSTDLRQVSGAHSANLRPQNRTRSGASWAGISKPVHEVDVQWEAPDLSVTIFTVFHSDGNVRIHEQSSSD